MKTLEIVKILEKHNFSQSDAIELAEAINGKSGLATKEDVSKAQSILKEDINQVKSELKKDINQVKSELKEDIADVRKDIADIRNDIVALTTSNKWIITLIGLSFTLTISLLVKIAFF